MAHEINNPLAGIMQNSQLIYSRLTQAIPANDKVAADLGVSMAAINSYMTQRGILKQLQSIHHASQRITQIIENMLTFSKKSDLQRKESDPVTLMENTLALLKNDPVLNHRQHGHSVKIIREYASCLPKIFCETSKIQQVMFNLFKNAVESMNAKTYDNDAPQLTIRLKSGQAHLHIDVEDNGTGIDTETCKHIFEPFFTTKGFEKGTGLGLSISYFIIVDHHGGQMTVNSTPGKGTCFTVKLPFRSGNRTG